MNETICIEKSTDKRESRVDELTKECVEKTTDADIRSTLMDEIDKLADLQEDISGLAHILQFVDKECREHTGSTEMFHVVRSLESYQDVLGNMIDKLEIISNIWEDKASSAIHLI